MIYGHSLQAEVLEIALRLVPMPSDGAILDIKVVSLKKQIGKRKRAAVKAGAVIDVAATGMSEKRAKLSKNGNRPPSAAKKAFRSFIRAARVSPSIFKGLSELGDSAQIEALRDRLSQKGFKFKGKYPNITEIKEAQQKKEQDDNLDGIDTSAILSPSRKRGGREASHKYERKSSAKGREDEDESEEEEFSL